jgi:phosphoglycerol transferase MdoB-like AlkP superfamily enzyme
MVLAGDMVIKNCSALFETMVSVQQPYLSVVLTVSTHNPFLINEAGLIPAKI